MFVCDGVSVCGLPDSFQSWFLLAHLHVWLLMVRLKREEEEGMFVVRQIVRMFWDDVEKRTTMIGVGRSGSIVPVVGDIRCCSPARYA